MNFIKKTLLMLAIICVTSPSSIVAYNMPKNYTLVDLGTLESDESAAYAINDKNQVVGTYKLQDMNYAFLWEEAKGITLLDMPSTAIPKLINNRTQISGEYTVNGVKRGFFWDPVKGFCDLGSLGGKNVWVSDMNSSGVVVGASETGKIVDIAGIQTAWEVHAFIWKNGQMTDLGILHGDLGLGGSKSYANSINDNGDVVGYSNCILVHKGKKLMSDLKAVIWQGNKINRLLENELRGIGVLMTNNNEAVTWSIVYKDQTEQEEVVIANFLTGRVTTVSPFYHGNIKQKVDGMFFLYGEGIIRFIDVSYDTDLVTPFKIKKPNVKNFGGFWKGLHHANDINSHSFIVGTAVTVYGEPHAFIARPDW